MSNRVAEYRQKSISELKGEATKVREELARSRWEHSLGKLKDTSKLKKRRRDLARILTILRQKEIVKGGSNG